MDKNTSKIINDIENGNNIFISGQAGVGKTYILKEIIEWLADGGLEYELSGSTGAAAINIKGTTLHRVLGIMKSSSLEQYEHDLKSGFIPKNYVARKLRDLEAVDLIIVDEISMVGSKLVELMDYVLKKAKKNKMPFGGVIMVFAGDFLQLPPINDKFAFESEIWEKADFKNYILKENKRQSNEEFINILSKARVGNFDRDVIDFLKNKLETKIENFDEATKLFSRNSNVDSENNKMISKLNSESKVFEAEVWARTDSLKNSIIKSSPPESIELKVGSKVMSLVNEESLEYINGSIGHIIEFGEEGNNVLVEWLDGRKSWVGYYMWEIMEKKEIVATFEQIPLRIAYAITIHKSQGQTIDGELILDCNGIFNDGQLYVGLSRIKNPENLKITGINNNHLRTSKKAIEFYRNID